MGMDQMQFIRFVGTSRVDKVKLLNAKSVLRQ